MSLQDKKVLRDSIILNIIVFVIVFGGYAYISENLKIDQSKKIEVLRLK